MLEKGLQRAKEELNDAWADAWLDLPWFLTAPASHPYTRKTMDYKNIIAANRRKKLEDEVVKGLSDPATTSVRVKSRYKEDIDDIESRFKHQYEIKREEFPTGYSATVTHQMKTPLEKKCEELTKRLNNRRVDIKNVVVAPRIVDQRINVKFDTVAGMPTRTGTIARSYFDAHTVEELAAAIEGLYFA